MDRIVKTNKKLLTVFVNNEIEINQNNEILWLHL